MLILPIKKKWFDMIALGHKKEEYREIKPYYTKRFQNIGLLDKRHEDEATNRTAEIALRNGYAATDPTLIVKVELKFGLGKEEWGADPNEWYYILAIKKVLRIEADGKVLWQSKKGR